MMFHKLIMRNIVFFTTVLFSILTYSYAFADSKMQKDDSTINEKTKSIRRFLINNPNDPNVPDYRKTFDEYIIDLEYIQKYGKIPPNPKKEADLSKANYDGIVQLK